MESWLAKLLVNKNLILIKEENDSYAYECDVLITYPHHKDIEKMLIKNNFSYLSGSYLSGYKQYAKRINNKLFIVDIHTELGRTGPFGGLIKPRNFERFCVNHSILNDNGVLYLQNDALGVFYCLQSLFDKTKYFKRSKLMHKTKTKKLFYYYFKEFGLGDLIIEKFYKTSLSPSKKISILDFFSIIKIISLINICQSLIRKFIGIFTRKKFVCISIMGVDGSGKSTAIKEVCTSKILNIRSTYNGWKNFTPLELFFIQKKSKIQACKLLYINKIFNVFLGLLLYVVFYFRRHNLIRKLSKTGGIILLDRDINDTIIDPSIKSSSKIINTILSKFTFPPKRDFIYIITDPKIAMNRSNNEHKLSHYQNWREALIRKSNYTHGVVVDNSSITEREFIGSIHKEIWDYVLNKGVHFK